MHIRTIRNILLGMTLVFLPVFHAHAAVSVAGWIPWWQYEEGIAEVEDHLRDINTIYPFVFEVDGSGGLIEKADFGERVWRDLFRNARRRDVEIIPTISWSNGDAIQETLSDKRARKVHIRDIAAMVNDGNFDGINIDYESKLAETSDSFILFLKELKDKLGSDVLTCTIEARTPPESKWREVPENIEYANDYQAMNRYCDRIEIMAYDQQRVDWQLNDEKSGQPYIPVADSDWVEKVLALALEDIDADKIMLGVPTYGREWELTVAPNWFKNYRNISSINLPDATTLAEEYAVNPVRNQAGELSFTYFPEDSPFRVLNVLPVSADIPEGHRAAAQALLFANYTGMDVPVRVVWYSDAKAIEDKVDLIKKYDLRGVAVFKFDGEEDNNIWDVL